jgi:putative peptide zinc metalloprotease protein
VPNLRERSNRFLSNLMQEKALGIEVQPEAYMAPSRKLLFVSYAIGSFIYRWVVTVSILFFLAKWLKPYKLESLSMMLALGALASMIFWPAYRMVKSIRQRGRLPDMKRKRVMVSGTILALLLVGFFALPLPVSRVREIGLVQVTEGNREYVHVRESGILTEVYVHDGQEVNQGQDLAHFVNPQFEFEREQYAKELQAANQQEGAIRKRLSEAGGDPAVRSRIDRELTDVIAARNKAQAMLNNQTRQIESIEVLKAPRSGTVMGAPKKEDLNRLWDKSDGQPLCSLGDTRKLRVLIPVNATDYRELRQNLEHRKAEDKEHAFLKVTILAKNRSDHLFHGRIVRLPDTDEKNVPVALTHKAGGTLATKPGGDPNVNMPLVQTYLVAVEFDDPDSTLVPGTLATAKISLGNRSAAWWTWRSIASALDIGLW